MQLLKRRNDLIFRLTVQSHMSLQRQDPVKGIIQPLFADPSVQDTLLHAGEIFFHLIEEQEHIYPRRNGGRKDITSLHTAGESHHMRGICQHHSIKLQFVPKQPLDQFRGQGRRHHFIIRDSRIKMSCIGGLHDMPHHNSLQAVIDKIPVHHAKGSVPLLTAHSIHTVCHMLVPEIQSVSRKMLGRTTESQILMSAIQVCLRHNRHPVRIVSIRPQADHWILPVV